LNGLAASVVFEAVAAFRTLRTSRPGRMNRFLGFACLSLLIWASESRAQMLTPASTRDADAVVADLPDLARQAITVYREENRAKYLNTLFRLQSVANDHRGADETLDALVRLRSASDPGNVPPLRAFQVSTRSNIARTVDQQTQEDSVRLAFRWCSSRWMIWIRAGLFFGSRATSIG
jgi:hypothetical protein